MVSLSLSHFRFYALVMAAVAVVTLGSSLAGFFHTLKTINGNAIPRVSVARVAMEHLPDMHIVARSGWFGLPPQEQAQASGTAGQSLAARFELKGVSRSGDKALAGAFIAEKNQPEHYYRIGDDLPGGAGTLDTVFADHIVVRQGLATAELPFPPTFVQKSN